ncbi:MAG: FG-GAP-like repeat-containing protein, partial [Acidimicrobiia bacterium]
SELMPDIAIEYSWDLEFIDADNDYDLDVAISCQTCDGSFLLRNDGSGRFDDASADLPQFTNNFDFETVDINGDGFADLTTLNDGPDRTRHENLFVSDGLGGFIDATAELWPEQEQITAQNADDNAVVIVDFDSDGDPDLLIGHLGRRDRFLVNDGTGHLAMLEDIFSGPVTSGTLGIAVADLNGDNVIDVVQSQGWNASDNRVFFGDALLPDTATPIIHGVVGIDGVVYARVHDNKTPVMPHDWQRVFAEGPDGETDLAWYGEALWRVAVDLPGDYRVCATDRAGNETCSDAVGVPVS